MNQSNIGGLKEVIGIAGDTVVPDWGIHLHFELQKGGYCQNRMDPYDLHTIREFYYPGRIQNKYATRGVLM